MKIKVYDSLYTKDSLGNTRVWFIEQKGDKYRTIAGLVDGQKVTSEYSTAEPKNVGKKNATTGEQQATAEIEAKYKKQLKTGYFKNINDVNKTQYIEPQLAKSYKDYSEEINFTKEKWGAQTKFNGICCLASKAGCYSRKGERFVSVPHIEKALKSFFDKNSGAVLHGELFNDDYREKLNEIVKLVRKTVHITDEDFKQSEKLIRFYIYDGYGWNSDIYNFDEDASYTIRKGWIDDNIINKYNYCEEVKTTEVTSKEKLDELFGKAMERGDEGLILRKLNMPYQHKRSKNLLKYKPLDSDEMVIVDIKPGTGNWSGKAKIISVKMKDGKVFDAVFKGSMLDAEQCLKEKNNWIGKLVTIHYNGITGLGCPQYAQFDYQNCLTVDK
jgi:DNA ligase 1